MMKLNLESCFLFFKFNQNVSSVFFTHLFIQNIENLKIKMILNIRIILLREAQLNPMKDFQFTRIKIKIIIQIEKL